MPQLFHPCLWALGKRAFALLAIFLTFLVALVPVQAQTCATAGKDGNGGTLTGIVNTYYPGTATANAGATTITLGTARGATTAISSGDLLLVIQMQDAGISSTNGSSYGDGTNGGGAGYNAANNTGKYEFVKATNAVPTTGGNVTIQGTGTGNGLLNTYTNAAYDAATPRAQRRFQVVRVPQYANAALSSGLTAAAWNGTTGGILALDIKDGLQLGGTVSVNGLGFRGGAGLQLQGAGGSGDDYRNTAPTAAQLTAKTGFHGSKGEGFAGTPRYVWDAANSAVVDTAVEGYPNGSMGRGAPGNAGGGGTDSDPDTANPGGNDENSGGGGGGNGGAGGRGGNCWQSETVRGGSGGVVFAEILPGRLVMGGGGGAGTRNNDDNVTGAASGAAGGGIVIIRTRKVLGTGTITANGASAFNDTLNDGGGGGGAGGSVVFFALSSTLTGLTVNANGGRGGDAWRTQAPNGTPGERHGPGGGGGGGAIYVSSSPASRTVTGGATGISTTANDAFNATTGSAGISAINLTSGQIPGVASGAECAAPSAVDLMNFAVVADPRGNVLLEWKTGYEISNLGFNIYRDSGGKRTRLNASLIGGSALLAGARTPFTAGFAYAWMDALASPKELPAYWLEDLDASGKTVMHGPVSPVAVGTLPPQSQSLMLSQLRSNAPGATTENISVVSSATQGKTVRVSSQNLQTQWDVAAKPGAKILINKAGWYRVTQPELVAAGFDVTKDPRFLQLFTDGTEMPLIVNGGLKGRLEPTDSIEFYGQALDTPSTNQRTYYLINGAQPGRRVALLPVSKADETRRLNFSATVERRDRFLYFPSLNNGEADNWFGAFISATSFNQSLTLRQLDQDATTDALLEVALQGLGTASHVVQVQVNGQEAGSLVFDGQLHQVSQFTISQRLLQEGANTVTLTASGGSSDFSVVDWLKLSYAHRYVADDNRLLFTATAGEAVRVSGFTTPGVRVFDLTDEANPVEVKGDVDLQGKLYRVTMVPQGSGERVLLAVSDKALERAAAVIPQVPSSWHLPSQGADVVMLTHGSLRGALEPLVQLRKQQGYAVAVVDVEDIYDEYSYGQHAAQAVQDFLAAAKRWKRGPQYVLLVGDASYDAKNYLGLGENDLVPTKVVWTNTFETASDEWLGDSDGDGIAEMAIGRLPVRTAAQAQLVVNRIVSYERGAQTNGVVLVADLAGEYDFEAASLAVEQTLPAGTSVQEIYRSRMDDATASQAIINAINRGPKLVNYAGHGSSSLWRGNLLTTDSVGMLTNQQALPVVISMTCLNNLFNDPRVSSLGETLLLSDRGGAIAVWASSGQTVAGAQELVDQEIIRQLFNGINAKGQPLSVGEAVMRAKAVARNEAVIQSWILLGDPLVRLR